MNSKNRFAHVLLGLLAAAGLFVGLGWRSPTPQSSPAGGNAPQKPAPKFATSKDGTRIAYDQTGKGPVVILVSGALSDRRASGGLASTLSADFTVISYDRRGRGDSGDTQPYTVQREVEDIEALIDAAGGSAFLFGSSSGAALSLEAAAKLPTKVTKAALFEPPYIVDETRGPIPAGFWVRMGEFVKSNQRGEAVALFMIEGIGVPPEMVSQMKRSPMWPNMEKLAHTLLYDGAVMGDTQAGKPLPADRWRTAKMPVLVMDGGASETWIRNSAAALVKVLPHASQRTLEGQDHSAAFSAPQVVGVALIEFFNAEKAAQ